MIVRGGGKPRSLKERALLRPLFTGGGEARALNDAAAPTFAARSPPPPDVARGPFDGPENGVPSKRKTREEVRRADDDDCVVVDSRVEGTSGRTLILSGERRVGGGGGGEDELRGD